MAFIPKFKKINNAEELDVFASTYTQCSGFNVNRDYYENNQVFGIYCQERMVAGFVLGTGETLRTLEVFVGEEHRSGLYQKVTDTVPHTEMCCFWMEPGTRKKTLLNFFVWFCVAYALRFFGTQQLLFGTNSVRLATLYSAASKAKLIHSDYLKQKRTFVFSGPRRYCLLGVAQILWYKLKRTLKIVNQRSRVQANFSKPEQQDFFTKAEVI